MLLLLFIRHDPGLVELEHVPVNVITGFHCLVPHLVFIIAPLFLKVNRKISLGNAMSMVFVNVDPARNPL